MIRFDSRQTLYKNILKVLGLDADSGLDDVVAGVDLELDCSYRPYTSNPASASLYFSDAVLTTSDGSKKVQAAVGGTVYTVPSSLSIDFQARTVSNASYLDIAFPASTVGQYRRIVLFLDQDGKIRARWSDEVASPASLTNAGSMLRTGSIALCYVDLICTNALGSFKSANAVGNVIEAEDLYRLPEQETNDSGTFTIVNNQAVAANITPLYFDPTIYKAFTIEYSIYRNTTGGGATELAQHGTLNATYKTVAGTWDMSESFVGDDAGVTISILASGQLQYTSTNITGTAASSYLKYTIKKIFV